MMKRLLPLAFAASLMPAATAQDTSPLIIEAGDVSHTFNVELAGTPEAIERGLMDRESLAADAGMVFDFGDVRDATMWMKSTSISLDMLFVDAEGTIVAIARNTVPQSERRIRTGTPVRAVVELNAGTARAMNIEPGAKVRHALFDQEVTSDQPEE